MILITGPTGTVGTELVRLLTERGVRFRAMAHDNAARAPLRERGIESVVGDFATPATLAEAMRDAEVVYLLTPQVPQLAAWEAAAVDAAVAAGVRHIVKHSADGAFRAILWNCGGPL